MLLIKFCMANSKLVSTPLAPHFRLSKQDCPQNELEIKYISHIPYANVIGSLMYAMICVWINLAYPKSVYRRYMANPGNVYWEALKWVQRYVKGTTSHGLTYWKGTYDPN